MDMGKGDRHAIFTKWDVDTQLFVCNFWLHSVACEILVPQPGIEPAPSALGAQTGREGPQGCLFLNTLSITSVILDCLALSFLLISPLQCHSCLSRESNLIL